MGFKRCFINIISFAHSNRDIKPENLILKVKDNDLSVQLVDFGLAQIETTITETASKTDSKTENATPVLYKRRAGTPAYVAPEVIDDSPECLAMHIGKPSDLWSVGVIIFMLLGGWFVV